jgi:hypothetical protein
MRMKMRQRQMKAAGRWSGDLNAAGAEGMALRCQGSAVRASQANWGASPSATLAPVAIAVLRVLQRKLLDLLLWKWRVVADAFFRGIL